MKNLGSQFGSGGTGLTDGTLAKAVRELQGITVFVATGAAPDTNVVVTGLGAADPVVSCVVYTAGVPAKIVPTVQTAGNLKFAEDTATKAIVVTFFKN